MIGKTTLPKIWIIICKLWLIVAVGALAMVCPFRSLPPSTKTPQVLFVWIGEPMTFTTLACLGGSWTVADCVQLDIMGQNLNCFHHSIGKDILRVGELPLTSQETTSGMMRRYMPLTIRTTDMSVSH
jgi:hypothetical protein